MFRIESFELRIPAHAPVLVGWVGETQNSELSTLNSGRPEPTAEIKSEREIC